MSKAVLFQRIQFSMSTLFGSIWPIDWILSGATTLGQSGPGSDGNEGALRIPQNWNLTIRLFSYPGHPYGEGSYFSKKMKSVYSTAPANRTSVCVCVTASDVTFSLYS